MNIFSQERILEDLLTPFQLIVESSNNEGRIFLGNQNSVGGFPDKWNYKAEDYEKTKQQLKDLNIVAIVCCADGTEIFPSDFTYLQLPIRDRPGFDISIYFEESFQFIEAQRKLGNVIIHCNAGASRSPSILIAYIMKKYGKSFDQAYTEVKNIRSCVNVSNFEEFLNKINI